MGQIRPTELVFIPDQNNNVNGFYCSQKKHGRMSFEIVKRNEIKTG